MKILLVEDSKHLGKYVKKGLEIAGFAVDWAEDGESGQWMAETSEYDVMVLDLMLPKKNGLELLEAIRKKGVMTHVLILTAKDGIQDRVKGLEGGADDYLIKPFEMDELIARVRALVRRKYFHKASEIRIGSLRIDTNRRLVYLNDRRLNLPPREYDLLELLAFNQGKVLSRTEIEEHIYDQMAEPMSNVADAAVYGLRKALDIHGKPSWITTRRGKGYMLENPKT